MIETYNYLSLELDLDLKKNSVLRIVSNWEQQVLSETQSFLPD